ncbi:MAG: c-type cytochrome [Acidobacteriota bacterium]
MRRAISRVVAVAVAGLALSSTAAAQGAFPPKSFTNLQVLPKNSAAADVIGTMRDLTRALGVRCQHCHVGEEGMPLETFDFVADTREAKRTARAMMRLTAAVNAQIREARPAAEAVTCYTCHRGATRPVHAPEGPKP